MTPKTPTHYSTHNFQFTAVPIPTAFRNSPCAALVSSLPSFVYRSSVGLGHDANCEVRTVGRPRRVLRLFFGPWQRVGDEYR